MEYLDVYDKDGNKMNKTIIRGDHYSLNDNEFIKIVLIFIKNDKGEYLIQKTSQEKGGVWATTGGHVKSGSTSKQTVIEEVNEELGIDISKDNFKLVDTFIFKKVIVDVFYLEKNIDIKDLVLQKEEVEYVSWLTKDMINNLINKDEFRKSNIPAFEKIMTI